MNQHSDTHLGLSNALLKKHWGLSGTLDRLPGENLNYRLDATGQQPMVLKLTSEHHADVELEEALIEHLDRASLPVPTSLPTNDGHRIIATEVDGHQASVRLQTFLQGTPWRSTQSSDELLASIGASLARVHLALADFDHDAARRSHAWDIAAAQQHRLSIQHLQDRQRRHAVEHCFHLHASCVLPLLESCQQGMLHGDFNDENILVDGTDIIGLLDFGDCLHGALVQDLGIALAYALEQHGATLDTAAHLIRGYDEIRSLSQHEQSMLAPLALTRLATYICINADMQAIDPADHMRNLHEDSAWNAIATLTAVPPRTAEDLLCTHCRDPRPAHVADAPIHAARSRHLSPSLSLNFNTPLHITTGRGQYLIAEDGTPYLDLVNNVCHVGHCHPHVVKAIATQAATLNTNTRYLHELIGTYAQRLCDTMPEPLDTCFFVNSGSEANELALRLARGATGATDALVIDGAYHGHTDNCIAMSPYKFNGPGGAGPSDWVHVAETPDTYRGTHRGDDAGAAYAIEVAETIGQACSSGRSIAAFFAEPILSCGGQIPLPAGYLHASYEHVRHAGGLCIADEVQVGFGRLGDAMWGFQLHDVVPDIVVLGKPIGNGHPMGAVITTRSIADAFNNGMEFFSTFGGNPVSCACGLAVLEVIEHEQLQTHAKHMGDVFLEGLKTLQARHELIGDIRGQGLFLGLELVQDRSTQEPAAREAADLINAMCARGVLLSTDGPLHNVIKIKPPMVLNQGDIAMTLRLLDSVLSTL
jgi:4-aminobutyrate aminotransferase-like enzyme/Ser/Thr protein kinase RdoA (MazF antagonist)